MKIKICGLHPARDVQLCIDLGVNFLGFVFYKRSPRNINLKDLTKKLRSSDDFYDAYERKIGSLSKDNFFKNQFINNISIKIEYAFFLYLS